MNKKDYFNEDVYLSEDNEYSVKHIYEEKAAYVRDIKRDAMKYGSNIQAYDEYIKMFHNN